MKKTLSIIFLMVIQFNLLSISTSNSDILNTADRDEISISFTGDILTHRYLYDKARKGDLYDFDYAFSDISKYLNSDINFCQLETVLTSGGPSSYPVFKTPYQLIYSIKKAGFSICSQASNHSLDDGSRGIYFTSKKFREADISLVGYREDLLYKNIIEKHNIKVGFLAYTYGTNGIKPPRNDSDIVRYISKEKIINDISEIKEKADLVIVYLHFGNEYQELPSAFQKEIVSAISSTGKVGLIVGSHVHRLQKSDIINKTPVIYGLGNFWSGQGSWSNMRRGQIGTIAKAYFYKENGVVKFSKIRFLPTFVSGRDFSVKYAPNYVHGDEKDISCFAINENKRLHKKFEVEGSC